MRKILEYTEHLLSGPASVLVKMIEMIPSENIQFRPTAESKSIAELVCHILSVMQTHIHAISDGYGCDEHAQKIPIEPRSIFTTTSLIVHANEVLQSIKEELHGVTPEVLERKIVYKQWDNYVIHGGFALMYVIEEFFHHRGQLSTYLRLLGLQPPFLYAY